jgi:hypothetical protein
MNVMRRMTESKMQTKRTWDAAFGGSGGWVVLKALEAGISNRRKVVVERVTR